MTTIIICNRCGDDDNGSSKYFPIHRSVEKFDLCPDCKAAWDKYMEASIEKCIQEDMVWLNTKVDKDVS